MIQLRSIAKVSRTVAGVGFLLLLVDPVLRLRPTPTERAILVGGERFRGPFGVAFDTDRIEPNQSPDGEMLGISARVVDADDGRELTLSSDELTTVGPARIRITGIGIAAILSSRVDANAKHETAGVNLEVWNEQSREDEFRLPTLPATIHARFFPAFEMGPGGPRSRSMLLEDPVLQLRLVPDHPGGPSGQAFFRPGDTFVFGSVELGVVELRHWATVELIERHRGWFLRAGLLLIACGAAGGAATWQLRRRRRDTSTSDESAG